MSPKNDFKPFSIRNDSNIVSQERYEADKSLQEGFPPENISTHVLNKALRQSSTIASVVANFIATESGSDVLDNGDIDKLTSQLNQALKKIATDGKVPNSRKINGKALTEDINLNASDVGAYTQTEVDRLIKTASGIPVGAPIPWPLPHPPIGYLTCNGSTFDKLQYPKLAEAYPSGRLPDLRGEFIRGWDDGRGADNGRKLLSWQESSTIASYAGLYTDKIGHALTDMDGTAYYVQDYYQYQAPEKSQSVSVGMPYSRIRPRNIAFNYIVKAE
ncbi:phage tail protein [Photorhabdus sp. RW14-46]|uniref:phage tail protein n=1 Tax=Photorhabdus sp. RW14-46 TaxID=2100168 RepID=UPI0013F451D8|nr:phage tail protein [Photorhabdus sp. RW14-46]NHB62090.1 DNA-packaging protein [Photorhabdus sp. RW14-46]